MVERLKINVKRNDMGLLDTMANALTSDFVQDIKPGFLGFKKAPRIDQQFKARGDMIRRAKELQRQYAPEHLGGLTPQQRNLFRGVAEEESLQKQYQQEGIKGLIGTGEEANVPQFYDPGEVMNPSTQTSPRDFSTLQVVQQPQTAGIQSMVEPSTQTELKPAYLDEEDTEPSEEKVAGTPKPQYAKFGDSGDRYITNAKESLGLLEDEAYIVGSESDYRPGVLNPNSAEDAFGLYQMTYPNRVKYGKRLGIDPGTVDPYEQQQMGRAYVKDRYGDFATARKFREVTEGKRNINELPFYSVTGFPLRTSAQYYLTNGLIGY